MLGDTFFICDGKFLHEHEFSTMILCIFNIKYVRKSNVNVGPYTQYTSYIRCEILLHFMPVNLFQISDRCVPIF